VIAPPPEPERVEQPPPLEPLEQPPPPPAVAPAAAPPSPPPITIGKGTRVLMFGDSMVHSGLGFSLEELVVARGGKFTPATKANATTLSWATGRALQDLLDRVRPDVVIIALASNELFVPNPGARRRDIRTIVERIGARPCVWIGPAPWLPEKGILGVVRESSSPCRFFESSGLVMERQRDGIHPTLRGGKTWADAVWQKTFASSE
jgi:hypothetical protein